MLLSIIVPAYNIGDHLSRCLRSLLDQDLDASDYEIVVINDGSQDNSLAVAEALALQSRNIVVHSQANQGLSSARNAGVRLARGKYLYFVDGDDYVASNVLGTLIRLMEQAELQVLGFGHAIVGPDDHLDHPRTPYDPTRRVAVSSGAQYLAGHHYLNSVWWYIVNRAFLAGLGVQFEVGRLVEDALFTAQVMCAASRFAYVPIDAYRYVRRPGSIMQTNTAAHTKKLVEDYERVVFGLEELRQSLSQSTTASRALLDRLEYRQQAYVFFLIGRLIRSDLPPKPILPAALERFRDIGMYPLSRFPGRDYKGMQYRLLTFVANRGYMLYPSIRIYRALLGGRRVEFRQG